MRILSLLLALLPTVVAGAEWQSLFNGRDLAGWEGQVQGLASKREKVSHCAKTFDNLRTKRIGHLLALTHVFNDAVTERPIVLPRIPWNN